MRRFLAQTGIVILAGEGCQARTPSDDTLQLRNTRRKAPARGLAGFPDRSNGPDVEVPPQDTAVTRLALATGEAVIRPQQQFLVEVGSKP